MRIVMTDPLVSLDRKSAVQRFSDLRNLVVLYFAAGLLGLEGIAAVVLWRETGNSGWIAMAIMAPLFSFLIFRFGINLRRGRSDWRVLFPGERRALEWADANLRTWVIGVYLLIAFVETVRWSFRPDDDPLLALIILGIALRVSLNERLTIYFALMTGVLIVVSLRPAAGLTGADTALWLSATIYGTIALLAFLAGALFTRRFTAAFLRVWLPQRQSLDEQNRMREELDLARTIQLSMLPRSVPEVDGIEISAGSIPATEVGGDFYDFYTRNGRFAIVQADVAGHGVGSGIVLSGIRTALRLLSDDLEHPEVMMSRLEKLVRETKTERMLITLGLVSISADRRSAIVISAGHPPVFHWRKRDGEVDIAMLPSLPLGTELSQPFTMKELALEEGDRLLIHTDGAYETRNPEGVEVGIDGLAQRFAAGGDDETAGETLERLVRSLDDFRGDVLQEDDVTLISVRISSVAGG